ncbi:phosphatidylethanolamine-binding protein [Penicillium chermesinum]|uniref:Phosphatidylethanolamine-binding protein n=1 Tax=Penicillium chermesinum TaxID=63820 RepID=A0A9W9PG19_9EURO|nr:phosphatidylethanolamine-binding protein [Penicillium chermesinum]KAJ5246184.1 phosphatidylethanolamine-binding protein [Penicillium chermesinum]KAJ6144471.1 phosphatidylethanolamine-binding protein [Penicillium chermesinum]
MPDVSSQVAVIERLEREEIPLLGVSFGSIKVTPGEKVDRKDTIPTPSLTVPAQLSKGLYTAICLDLDAPFRSFNLASPIAHWVQTDLSASSPESLELKSAQAPVAPWIAAGPPPGAAPHRYLVLLYEQLPSLSDAPNLEPFSTFQRVRIDVDALTKKLHLGEMVAVNYFVSN